MWSEWSRKNNNYNIYAININFPNKVMRIVSQDSIIESYDIIINNDKSIHLIWTENENNLNKIKYQKLFAIDEKSQEGVSEFYYSFSDINLVVDENNTLFIIWNDYENGKYMVYYRFSVDEGISWSSVITLITDNNILPKPVFLTHGNEQYGIYFDEYYRTIHCKMLNE